MFLRLVGESLRVRWRRKLAAAASVALATAGASALLGLSLGVGDLVSAELRRAGANILVEAPAAGTLAEADLPGLKNHFWKNSVLGFAPFLPVETTVNGRPATVVGTWVDRELDVFGEKTRAGLATVVSGWKLEGRWMSAPSEAMVGSLLARELGIRAGDRLDVAGRALTTSGVFSSGGEDDRRVLVDLAVAQSLAGRPGRVATVLVSAKTTPEARLAELLHPEDGSLATVIRQMREDPRRVRPEIQERFACTNFPTSVALQIEGKVPGAVARPIRQVTESEGALLDRVEGLFFALALAALLAGALGVLAAMTGSVVERRKEIGLLKALGATDGTIAALVLTEAGFLGLLGGIAGLALGAAASRLIALRVFSEAVPLSPALAALSVLVALGVALAGAAWPLRQALRVRPTLVLHEA